MRKVYSTRLVDRVALDDFLYCHLGDHWKEARDFPIRRRGNWEQGAATSYRSYCKECHRTRNGKSSGPVLKSAGHKPRESNPSNDPNVKAARAILRDHRAEQANRPGFLYLIAEEGSSQFAKIGFSVDPEARVGELQTGNPRKLLLVAKKTAMPLDESKLHTQFLADNVLGEWFSVSNNLLDHFGVEHMDWFWHGPKAMK